MKFERQHFMALKKTKKRIAEEDTVNFQLLEFSFFFALKKVLTTLIQENTRSQEQVEDDANENSKGINVEFLFIRNQEAFNEYQILITF